MAGRYVPFVLVPRYTTYAGATSFITAAIPVSAYSGLHFDFWHGPVIGTFGSIILALQESNDGSSWGDCTGSVPGIAPAEGQVPVSVTITKAWLRLVVAVAGTDMAVTCWAEGFLELREK
jgi:hypothetical protein